MVASRDNSLGDTGAPQDVPEAVALPTACAGRVRHGGRGRPGARVPRPERLGEDDHTAYAARPGPAERRHHADTRPRTALGPARGSGTGRRDRREPAVLRQLLGPPYPEAPR